MVKLPQGLRRSLLAASLLLATPQAYGQQAGAQQENTAPCCTYEVSLTGSPADGITDLLEQSLLLYRFQDDGVPSIPLLRRRAESDHEIAIKVLRSFGYFEAKVTSEVVAPDGGGPAMVQLSIVPGRAFVLAEHRIEVADPRPEVEAVLPTAQQAGSPVGRAAEAAPILAAESAIVGVLRRNGFPYASRLGRDAVADPAAAEISVRSTFRAGPRLVFGETRFEGIPDIDETYLRTYKPWKEGEPVDIAQLNAFQRELIGTGLFNAGAVTLPDTPPEGPSVPVTATMEQRPFRSIVAGAWFSSDTGPGGRLEFWHRNLFGANESINIRAEAGLEERRLETRFRKPQFRRPGQDFITGLSLRDLENDAFDERGGTFGAGLERRLSPFMRVGAGGLVEVTETKSSDADGMAILFGIPVFVTYDDTNDPLNPAEGIRARAAVTPFAGTFDHEFTSFLRGDLTATTYFGLDAEDRYIIALRGRAGSVLAQDLSDVPGGQRLFSGGGGSVRGYAERSIGPLNSQNDPTGGLSVLEFGAEFRARIVGDFGAAVFIEGASVAEEVVPVFSEGVQYSAGGGLRYFSPIGPIRIDVGVPLNPRDSDNNFQVYFSIGQAF